MNIIEKECDYCNGDGLYNEYGNIDECSECNGLGVILSEECPAGLISLITCVIRRSRRRRAND